MDGAPRAGPRRRAAGSSPPGGPDELIREGKIVFDLGNFFAQGLGMALGQANVKRC
ncbi:MAG: hypothetical protein ACRDQH_19105 [Pseudonocardiaceae bacterium]